MKDVEYPDFDRMRQDRELLDEARQDRDEIKRLRGILERCRTVLGNMALENEGAIFRRWPINHEPLRADARGLLPVIDEALAGP